MEQKTADINHYYKYFKDIITQRFLKEKHLNHFLEEIRTAFSWTLKKKVVLKY